MADVNQPTTINPVYIASPHQQQIPKEMAHLLCGPNFYKAYYANALQTKTQHNYFI